jgi:hypothetical protein
MSCRRSSMTKQNRNRRAHPQGNPRAAEVPQRCRPRLPDAVAQFRHAVGRREPAHPACLADRLRPDRRALRAGRALHRPAPARQCPAAGNAQAPARYRQHGHRGRARRGRHPHRRLCGRHRPGMPACMAARSSPRARRKTSWPIRASITGKYLSGELAVEVPASAANRSKKEGIKVVGARGNNLKNVSASVPLGVFTCVTGVSGGGKSTFLIETLYKAAARRVNGARENPGDHDDRIDGLEHSTRSSTSTSRRSAARRAPTRPPTPAPSPRSATGSPACPKPRRAATSPAASRSTSRAAAARPARATASSRSRCTSCPMSTSPATSATASATTARRSMSPSRASRSPTCST